MVPYPKCRLVYQLKVGNFRLKTKHNLHSQCLPLEEHRIIYDLLTNISTL